MSRGAFSWKGGIRLIDEDVSRRTIAVSIKATKLTGRVLAQACLAVGRKIKKAHRARQTPHGKQTVRQLMGHGAATNSIEVESPKDFDRVARKWNVDYAFYKTGPDKYLLFSKVGRPMPSPLVFGILPARDEAFQVPARPDPGTAQTGRR